MENWRVVVLGTNGVGKSALLIQFSMNCFVESFDPTIEDGYRTQLVVDNHMCLLDVLDTAGGEEYATMRDQYIRGAQGLILVYSVTSRSSFEFLKDIHQSIRRVKQDNPIFMLVGNRCDLTWERQVSKADGAALARQYGCDFIETSAKTTQNVERLFINIVRSLRQTRQNSDTKSKQEPPQPAKRGRSCDCVIV